MQCPTLTGPDADDRIEGLLAAHVVLQVLNEPVSIQVRLQYTRYHDQHSHVVYMLYISLKYKVRLITNMANFVQMLIP